MFKIKKVTSVFFHPTETDGGPSWRKSSSKQIKAFPWREIILKCVHQALIQQEFSLQTVLIICKVILVSILWNHFWLKGESAGNFKWVAAGLDLFTLYLVINIGFVLFRVEAFSFLVDHDKLIMKGWSRLFLCVSHLSLAHTFQLSKYFKKEIIRVGSCTKIMFDVYFCTWKKASFWKCMLK